MAVSVAAAHYLCERQPSLDPRSRVRLRLQFDSSTLCVYPRDMAQHSQLDQPLLRSRTSVSRWTAAHHPLVLAAARLVLCERFAYELYDKIARFSFWSDNIADSGFGASAPFLMVFIILLLVIGLPAVTAAPLLSPLSKWRRWLILAGFICLVLFQLPSTILFESGAYEISSSVSIIGGLLLATCTSLQLNNLAL